MKSKTITLKLVAAYYPWQNLGDTPCILAEYEGRIPTDVIPLHEFEVTIELPAMSQQELTQEKVKLFQREKAQIKANAEEALAKKDEQIQALLALPAPKEPN